MASRTLLAWPVLLALAPFPAAAATATWTCTIGTSVFGAHLPAAFRIAEPVEVGNRVDPVGARGPHGTRYTVVIDDANTFMAEGDYWRPGPDDQLRAFTEALSITKANGHLADVITSYGPLSMHATRTATGACALLR